MSDLFVPATASNFQERWVIVCVNPNNPDDKMEFCSVVELNAELFRLKAEVERLKAEKDQAECDYDNCQKRKVSIDNHRFDLFTENKNLKAEVERLTAEVSYDNRVQLHVDKLAAEFTQVEVERLDTLCKQLMKQHSDISCENIMLRKAGDAMAEIFKNQMDNDPENVGYLQEQLVSQWNAAKAGPPIV